MKKFTVLSVVVISLMATSACSVFYGKDKNELQPKLGAAPRTSVSPNTPAPIAAPQMLGVAQQPGQPETFVNSNVGGLNTAPAAIPGYDPAFQQVQGDNGTFAGQPNPEFMAPPQPMAQPMAAPVQNTYAPQEPTIVATISKNKRLPASLQPTYNNPLNYEGVPATNNFQQIAPMAPQAQYSAPAQYAPVPTSMNPVATAPITKAPSAPSPVVNKKFIPVTPLAPAAAPANLNSAPIAPVANPDNAPTQPVGQMQLYTTDPKAQQ